MYSRFEIILKTFIHLIEYIYNRKARIIFYCTAIVFINFSYFFGKNNKNLNVLISYRDFWRKYLNADSRAWGYAK